MPTELVPDHPGDRRGQEPTEKEEKAILKKWGLKTGCTLLMGGHRYFFTRVGTLGEEEGEQPCVWGYRYLENGNTAAEMTLLNVWRMAK